MSLILVKILRPIASFRVPRTREDNGTTQTGSSASKRSRRGPSENKRSSGSIASRSK